MPNIISLEEKIYVFKVEGTIENFTVEGVRKRLQTANPPIVLSLLESDKKSFLVVSYKTTKAEIKHWQTWIALENFVEFYKHLLIQIDEEKDLYKCCGPVSTFPLSNETNAFVISAQEPPNEMSRENAEFAILNEGRKKVFRRGSQGTAVISFMNKDRIEHLELNSIQEIQIKHVPAFIVYGGKFEFLEADKWSTLEKMRPNDVLSLVALCKYKVKSFWQTDRINDVQINSLPSDAFDKFKSEVLFEKNIQVHVKFLKNWLEQHSQYSTYASDILTGTFNLERHARATGTPQHVFTWEIICFFQRFEVFRLDIYDINKIQIVVLYRIPLQQSKLVPFKVNSCVADLVIVKRLVLCCYVADYLEKKLKNIIKLIQEEETISKETEIASLQKDLHQLDSSIVMDTLVIESLVKNQCDYINIYNLGAKKTIFLWLGEARPYPITITDIVLFVKSKELLDEDNLNLLIPQEDIEPLQQISEPTITPQLEM